MSKAKNTIGRVEVVEFPELDLTLHARVDTGAKTSALWASKIAVDEDGVLKVVLLDDIHPEYSGKELSFDDYERTVVASSNGITETRYKVKLLVKLVDRKIRASFTLTNRSTQVYPVLVGRNVLLGKFIVDVSKGSPLVDAEQQQTKKLRQNLEDNL